MLLQAFELQFVTAPFYSFSRGLVSKSYSPGRLRLNRVRALCSSSPVGNTSIGQPKASVDSPPNDVQKLELPLPVKYVERTTPLLAETEARRYIYPLLCRGWTIKSLKPNDEFNEIGHESPFLVGQWAFKGPVSARKLFNELLRIEDLEKHHASFNLWSGKRPVFTVLTQTHSARKHPITSQDNSTEPNITLRDVRLAVLLENFLQESQIPLFNGNTERSRRDHVESGNLSWEELLSQNLWRPQTQT